MPIQAPQFMGMGQQGGQAQQLGQQAQMTSAKRDSDTASALTAVNSVGATALAFIPVVGPILSALAGGIGAAVNAKAQDDAKKKMASAQQGGPVQGNSATGLIQGSQIGQSPQQSQRPDTNHINDFLASLGTSQQQRSV